LEFVGIVDGVEYYNDSKGTNVDAVRRALESFPGPVVLLVGGRYKSGDFGILAKLMEEKVRMLIVFGEAGEKIKSIIGGITRTETASNLKDAVRMAHDNSTFGDIVLLSPGCSSFDEFNNYKERGIAFNDMIDRMGSKEDQGIWTDSLP
ncbi:MAG: UDP-N-acetylmuramoyl-L-alanine--D-glutamate ligase, partial [Thermodesulfobacteriota bacterium]|nr:UDP-N-acetylmuramoyl-L-alanine--D-glutamate ligase [Thermodesulfobacteriota bacterium]